VLVVGGALQIEVFDRVSKTFSHSGDLLEFLSENTATLLAEGTVLVAGGGTPSDPGITKAVQIYNPDTQSVSETTLMSTPRYGHTATRLLDGRVLVAGGFVAGQGPGLVDTNSAELFVSSELR
jgi:hypothetical protein